MAGLTLCDAIALPITASQSEKMEALCGARLRPDSAASTKTRAPELTWKSRLPCVERPHQQLYRQSVWVVSMRKWRRRRRRHRSVTYHPLRREGTPKLFGFNFDFIVYLKLSIQTT